jgi:hypothetical protein
MKSFESAGLWWLPESPDTRTVGIVTYSDDEGFILKIPFGFLGKVDHSLDRLSCSHPTPIAYGVLQNGKCVTLVDGFMTSASIAMPGTGRERYFFHRGFVGDVHCEANPIVDAARVSYLNLRDWAGWSPTCQMITDGGGRKVSSVSYNYEQPEPTVLATGDGYTVRFGYDASWSAPSVKGFNLEHDCRFVVELEKPLPFDDFQSRYLELLWQFLSFCLNRSTHEIQLRIQLSGQDQWLDVGRVQKTSQPSGETIEEYWMLLSMRQIGKRLNDVLNRWLSFEGDERRAVSLLVSVIGDRSVPLDLRFLVAVQALEALSRVDVDQYELSTEEFERRFNGALESIADKKTREWAERKLRYANYKSFIDLIRELLSQIGGYVDSLAPDQKRFLADLRNNRNFYTHRDEARVEYMMEGDDLYVLTDGVMCLLRASVLRRLGFSQEETKLIMDDCQGVAQVCARVAKQYRRCGNTSA